MSDQISLLTAEFEKAKQGLTTVQAKIKKSEATVRSKNRLASITVDAVGAITQLTFHSTEYRKLAPAELAELVLDTMKKAQEEAAAKVAKLMEEHQLPVGTLDLDSLLPSSPPTPDEIITKLRRATPDSSVPAQAPPPGEGWTGERPSVTPPRKRATPKQRKQ